MDVFESNESEMYEIQFIWTGDEMILNDRPPQLRTQPSLQSMAELDEISRVQRHFTSVDCV